MRATYCASVADATDDRRAAGMFRPSAPIIVVAMRWGVAVMLVVVGACGGADTSADGSLPLADGDVVADTGPATDLAPSQVAASTVPRPETPPPCVVDDLTLWTAQVVVGNTTADAVIRMRNDGDIWCEADISRSPLIDPAIEPDVWLEPDDWADLVVGQQEPDCADPATETIALVDVNGESVGVPTTLMTCGWWLTAFYPNDRATERCATDDLELSVVENSLIVRNSSFLPCELGAVTEVTGAESLAADPGDIQIWALGGGDIVAIELGPLVGADCSDEPATLVFEAAGAIEVPGLGGCFSVELGAAGPWFDPVSGPLRDWPGGEIGVALTALDPFPER